MGILNMYTSQHGRGLGVLLGMCVHILAFFLIFLYMPDLAVQQESRKMAYIFPK